MAQIGQQEVELVQGIIGSLGHVPQSDNIMALLTQWLLILISQISDTMNLFPASVVAVLNGWGSTSNQLGQNEVELLTQILACQTVIAANG